MSSIAVKQEEVSTALPTKTVPCTNENDSLAQRQEDEDRGEGVTVKREEDEPEQRDPVVQTKKTQASPGRPIHSSKSNAPSFSNHNIKNSNNGSQQPPPHHQLQQRFNNPHTRPNMGPVPNGPGPRGSFPMGRGYGAPPPYGYPGGHGNYPPPPHFHHPHASHHHHPHMMGPGGPYHHGGLGPYGGMKGNFPPMGPYSGGPPGPYGMPQYPPPHHSSMNPNFGNNMHSNNMGPVSSNDSISSKSSMNSKKKRTIDGMQGGGMQGNMPIHMQNSYLFRRTDSTTSTTSTVTCGNNTSTETRGDDSHRSNQNHSDDPALGSLNMDSMMFGDHRPQGHQSKASLHRRELSGASTASTLSVGGFSLASYERGNGKYHMAISFTLRL